MSSPTGAQDPCPPPPTAPPQPPPTTAVGIPLSSAPTTATHFFPQPPGRPLFRAQSHAPARWSTGLFDCFDDVGNCCVTCLCPCVTFGRVAEIVDRGSTSCGASGALYAMIMCLTGCSCFYSCFYRSKLRGLFFLEETPCSDCLVHCCCESCALCQEYRELQRRGLDPCKGWQWGMEMQEQEGGHMPPMVEGAMTR